MKLIGAVLEPIRGAGTFFVLKKAANEMKKKASAHKKVCGVRGFVRLAVSCGDEPPAPVVILQWTPVVMRCCCNAVRK
jgi:hypothetical protein